MPINGDSPTDAPSSPLPPDPAPRIGRYTVGPEIGRGGMGAVHEVWDADLARTLAMKRLLAEPAADTPPALLQRFVREARVTGQLSHPGVVPVHELGLDDEGRLYFTMRRVRGQDLGGVFADALAGRNGWHRVRALEVLLKICDTVAYAHSLGVVHRDLKPLNVMVGEFGEVYVLDWGLAKRLDAGEGERGPADHGGQGELAGDPEATLPGTVLGTPSYMPPEQAEGHGHRVDRRGDVYALGAMLYTLLAGRAPYALPGERASSHELLERVRRGPPHAVAELAPGTPADLVLVCEGAMRRDPAERYPSAAEMAGALRDHLDREQAAAAEARRLRGQLADAQGIAEFLKGLFRVEDPDEAERPVTLLELLERGAARIEVDLADQPAMRASVHATLGDVLNSIGAHPRAIPHHREAVAAAREHGATRPGASDGDGAAPSSPRGDATLAQRLSSLGSALVHAGAPAEAEERLREAIAIWRGLEDDGMSLARALSSLGQLYWLNGRTADAKPLLREAVALCRGKENEVLLANSLLLQGVMMDSDGDIERGEKALLEALEIRRKLHGHRHEAAAQVLTNLAVIAITRKDFESAVERSSEAISIRLVALGADHPSIGVPYHNLGYALRMLGRLAEAEEATRRAESIRRGAYGPAHPLVGHSCCVLASIRTARGDREEARRLIAQIESEVIPRVAADHPLRCWIETPRGELLEAEGDHEGAEAAFRRAVELSASTHIPLKEQRQKERFELAEFYLRRGRDEDAVRILAPCLEIYERCFLATDPIRIRCAELLGAARRRLERGGGGGLGPPRPPDTIA